MFYLFVLSIAFFLMLLIVLKSEKSLSDYVLLIWMILVAAHVMLIYLHNERIVYHYPQLLGLAVPLPVLHGALLYFYCVSVTRENFARPGLIVLCLLPFVALSTTVVPFFMLPAEQKIYVFEHQNAGFGWFTTIQSIIVPVCGLFFSLLTINEIRKHRRRLFHTFSNHDKKMLRWLFVVAICIAVIWTLSVPFNNPIIFDAVVTFILLIALMGIKQAPIFDTHHNTIATPGSKQDWNAVHVQHNHLTTVDHLDSSLKTYHDKKNDESASDENNKLTKGGLKVGNFRGLRGRLTII
ncbi:hypothetical protein WBG78_22640 [Chryseolinea sp. T2]|uniref:hypothetical protein n=1 Tax=Chryseolinea sp. T2 TaxID=3129255 RepID=UPI0030788448